MAAALISLVSQVPVRRDTAMTGEVTLRGKVLEVGGVKEKVLAAHRAGLKEIVLPKKNKKDLEDIPTKTKKELKFTFVETMDEVLKHALVKDPFKIKPTSPRTPISPPSLPAA